MARERQMIPFDHHSPEYAQDWVQITDDMRKRCPVAWSEAHAGFWVATRYDDVLAIAKDWKTFSSDNDLNHERKGGRGITIPPNHYQLLLNESDPPKHSEIRDLEVPFFTPEGLMQWEQIMRVHLAEAIEKVIASGHIDFAYDLTLPALAKTTLQIVGIDLAEWEYFATAAHGMSYLPTHAPNFPHAEIARIQQRLCELCALRRAEPKDDITTALLRGKVGGRPLTDAEATLVLSPLVFGGFDTTAALILNALHWLSDDTRRVLRYQLLKDSKLMENAIEEFLRYFSPIHGVARNLTHESELSGQHLETGERVFLNWAAANRDPEMFEHPHELCLDRQNARKHAAFGFGLHRCLGANVARMEIRAALTAVLTSMPNYRIEHEKARRYPSLSLVNGWITMPATFPPCKEKKGASHEYDARTIDRNVSSDGAYPLF